MRKPLLLAAACAAALLSSCNKGASKPALQIPARPAAAQGSLVVVGTLQALPAPLPANDLYKYAYVMKYSVDSVVEGSFTEHEILVAHYDPRTPRGAIQDDQKGKVGGDVSTFHEGDRHYLVLRPIDSAWSGAIEDNYPQEKAPRWFSTWAQRL